MGLGFRFDHNGLPNVSNSTTTLCAGWNADYVDQVMGEDVKGELVSPNGRRFFPASFARFFLHIDGPLDSFELGGPQQFLDDRGCVQVPALPLVHVADAPQNDAAAGGVSIRFDYETTFRRPDGVAYLVKDAFTGATHVVNTATSPDTTATHYPSFAWNPAGIWNLPPAALDTKREGKANPMTQVAGVVSRVLAAPDMGLTPTGSYVAEVGKGCNVPGKPGDSCYEPQGSFVAIGLSNTPLDAHQCSVDADCPSIQFCNAGTCSWPDQSRWKFINAHEIGHQIQDQAMGTIGNSYSFTPPATSTCPERTVVDEQGRTVLLDPPCGEHFCGCQHVTAANGLHCLQSIEDGSAAAVEGWGQFYASKTWNDQTQNDCGFIYYKEFLNPAGCPFPAPNGDKCVTFNSWQHGPVTSVLPPVAVSCKDEFRWRNTFCPMNPDYGTELDWMRFFWNVNTSGPNKSPMTDLFQIYRRACFPSNPNPGSCRGGDVGWEERQGSVGFFQFGFRNGAERHFGALDPRYQHVIDVGLHFGVDTNLQP